MISALPILGLRNNEQVLLKLLFFPVAWRCFWQKIVNKRIVPRVERHGEILAYMTFSFIIGYCVCAEAYSSPLNKIIYHYA